MSYTDITYSLLIYDRSHVSVRQSKCSHDICR